MRQRRNRRLSVRVFLSAFFIQILCGSFIMLVLYYTIPKGLNTEKMEEHERTMSEFCTEICNSEQSEIGVKIDGYIEKTGDMVTLWNIYTDCVTPTGSRLGANTVKEYAKYKAHMGEEIWTYSHPVYFKGTMENYELRIEYCIEDENLLEETMFKALPAVAAMMTAVALVSSVVFTLAFVRPIKKTGEIAERMTELDFSKKCGSRRRDEIGVIARSLDELSEKLEGTLGELNDRNEALSAEIARANALEEQRSMFFSAAAHELKTPLSIVDGQLSGMLDEVGVYKDRDTYLAKSLINVKRMEKTVRDILAVSRLRAGTEPQRESIDFSSLLKDQTEIYKEIAEAKNITVHADIEDDIFTDANRELIRDAVGAVLSNAVSYSPDGETVYITAKRAPESGIVVFSVENTGVFIDENELAHLFEAFYRVDRSRSRQSGGSGLGLYLVKLVMDSMGGECRMDNTEKGVVTKLLFK